MYQISKEFHFEYGHRVWCQELNEEYALSAQTKCRFLHGHSGRVVIFLASTELNQQGMVVDFCNLNWLKKFIDDNIDHKFIIDRNDPLFPSMMSAANEAAKNQAEEYDSSFYMVDFVPTSENLAKWMFEVVQEKMEPLGIKVSKVEWWETPKSRSTYIGGK